MIIKFLKALFGIRPSEPPTPMSDAMGDFTPEEIETIGVLMGSREDPGPLRSALTKIVNRAVERHITYVRQAVKGQDWPRAAQHEGSAAAYQEMILELESVAWKRKVSRTL